MPKYEKIKYNPITDENLKSLKESINFVKKLKNNKKVKSNLITKKKAAQKNIKN